MQPIPLEPGMRVRCVDQLSWAGLDVGAEHIIEATDYHEYPKRPMVRLKGLHGWVYARRFKPIVRVKAPTSRLITTGPFAGMNEFEALDLVRGGY